MTTQRSLLASLAIACILTGCVTIEPGNDKLVVQAERTTKLALETFDTFLKWEYDNREVLSPIPEIRASSDRIRTNGPGWLRTARTLTQAYKENRTDENKAALETWVALLRAAIGEAQNYLPTSLK